MSSNVGLPYAPPLFYFDGITYDPAFFPSTNYITLDFANNQYLARVGIAVSIATLTAFNGLVNFNSSVFFYGAIVITGGVSITGGLTCDTLHVTGLITGDGGLTITAGNTNLLTTYINQALYIGTSTQYTEYNQSGINHFITNYTPSGLIEFYATTALSANINVMTFSASAINIYEPTTISNIGGGTLAFTIYNASTSSRLAFLNNTGYGGYNPSTVVGDNVCLISLGADVAVSALNITPWSGTSQGLRFSTQITPYINFFASLTGTFRVYEINATPLTTFTSHTQGGGNYLMYNNYNGGNFQISCNNFTGVQNIPLRFSSDYTTITNNFDLTLNLGGYFYSNAINNYFTNSIYFQSTSTGVNREINNIGFLQFTDVNNVNIPPLQIYKTGAICYIANTDTAGTISLNTWNTGATIQISNIVATYTTLSFNSATSVILTSPAFTISGTSLHTGLATFSAGGTFNSVIPTCSITATTATQLCNYTTVSGLISSSGTAFLSSANAWTGNTNTFNSFLPTSTITATTANQFVNYTTATGLIATNQASLLTLSNNWTGATNTFVNISANAITTNYINFLNISTYSIISSVIKIGVNSGGNFTGATNQISIGTSALTNNLSGTNNIAIGGGALTALSSTNNNVAIGTNAGNAMNGSQNVFIGQSSGILLPTGNQNTCIGATSFNSNTIGSSNNTCIGFGANGGITTVLTKSTALGHSAQNTASNQVMLGTATELVYHPNTSTFVSTSTFNGNIQIGTTTNLGASVLYADNTLSATVLYQYAGLTTDLIFGKTTSYWNSIIAYTADFEIISTGSSISFYSGLTNTMDISPNSLLQNLTFGSANLWNSMNFGVKSGGILTLNADGYTKIGFQSQLNYSMSGIITNATYTVASPLMQLYQFSTTANGVWTIPEPATAGSGCIVYFKRAGTGAGNPTIKTVSIATVFMPNNSTTLTNQLVLTGYYQICLISSGTYWLLMST